MCVSALNLYVAAEVLATVRCAGSLFGLTNVVRHFMLALLSHELAFRNEVLCRPGGVIRMPHTNRSFELSKIRIGFELSYVRLSTLKFVESIK